MAWTVVQEPGSRLGPCESCSHTDCGDLRALAASCCPGCSKPIGYGEPYTSDPFVDRCVHEAAALSEARWWHFGCAQDAVEDKVKTMVSTALAPAAPPLVIRGLP